MTTDRPTEPCPEPRADRESPPEPSSWASSAALTPPPDRPAEPCPVCKGQFVACVRCDGAGIVLSPPTTEPRAITAYEPIGESRTIIPPTDERATVPGPSDDPPYVYRDSPKMAEAALHNQLAAAEAERDKLQAFKDWVHDYLDQQGVPHHPPGTHGAAGCRIGDRMDWLMAKLHAAEAEVARLGTITAEQQQWRMEQVRFLAAHAAVLIEAGYQGDGALDGIKWLRARAEAGEAIIRRYKDCHDSDNDHDPCGCKVCDLAAAYLASLEKT